MPNLTESTRSRKEILTKVTIIAQFSFPFLWDNDYELYMPAEAFLTD